MNTLATARQASTLRPGSIALFALLVLVAGCRPESELATPSGEPDEGSEESGSSGESALSEENEGTESGTAGTYALEEWGLVRIIGDEVELATSLPLPQRVLPSRFEEAAPRKPVIYLFPDEAWNAEEPISIRVGLPSEHLNEAWPEPDAQDGSGFDWTVTVGAETCNGDMAPAAHSAHCAPYVAPMICEAEELRRYLREDAPCISVGDTRTPALIYNGYLPELGAPARVTDDGLVVGSLPIAVLWWRASGTVYRASDLEPGTRLSLADIPPTGNMSWLATEFERDLTETLESTGMTRSQDFVSAWRSHLVGRTTNWQVFGFYDPDAIDDILPLSAEPVPASVTRVLAFTVERPAETTVYQGRDADDIRAIARALAAENHELGSIVGADPDQASAFAQGQNGAIGNVPPGSVAHLTGSADADADLGALLGSELGSEMAQGVLGDMASSGSFDDVFEGIAEEELLVGLGTPGEGIATGSTQTDTIRSGTGGLGVSGIGGSGGVGGPNAVGTTTPGNPVANVSLGELAWVSWDVGDPLDEESVRRSVRGHFRPILYCLDTGIEAEPGYEATFSITFSVGAEGRATDSNASTPQSAAHEAMNCVARQVTRIRFPEHQGESSVPVAMELRYERVR